MFGILSLNELSALFAVLFIGQLGICLWRGRFHFPFRWCDWSAVGAWDWHDGHYFSRFGAAITVTLSSLAVCGWPWVRGYCVFLCADLVLCAILFWIWCARTLYFLVRFYWPRIALLRRGLARNLFYYSICRSNWKYTDLPAIMMMWPACWTFNIGLFLFSPLILVLNGAAMATTVTHFRYWVLIVAHWLHVTLDDFDGKTWMWVKAWRPLRISAGCDVVSSCCRGVFYVGDETDRRAFGTAQWRPWALVSRFEFLFDCRCCWALTMPCAMTAFVGRGKNDDIRVSVSISCRSFIFSLYVRWRHSLRQGASRLLNQWRRPVWDLNWIWHGTGLAWGWVFACWWCTRIECLGKSLHALTISRCA